MKRQKLIFKWSKKERDMMAYYPDRNGKILSKVVFDGLNHIELWVKSIGYEGFRDYVEKAGYEYESLHIVFTKKQETTVTNTT